MPAEPSRCGGDDGSGDRLDADWALGGTVTLARSAPQSERAREEVDEARQFGFGRDHLDLLDAEAASKRLNATSVRGGGCLG